MEEVSRVTQYKFYRVRNAIRNIVENEAIDKQNYLKMQLDDIEKAKKEGYDLKIHDNKLLIMFLQEIILRLVKENDDIKYYKLEIDKVKDEILSEFK